MAAKTKTKTTKKKAAKMTPPKAVRTMGSKATKARQEKRSAYDTLRDQLGKESQSGGDFFRFKEGTTVIRLIPFLHDGDEFVFAPDLKHWIKDSGDKGKSVVCLERNGNKCPICDAKDQFSDKTWKDIRPQKKFMANTIVRAGADSGLEDDELKTLGFGVKLFTELCDYIAGEKSHLVGKVLDPKKGRDFKIIRTGREMKTRYELIPMKNATPIGTGDFKAVDLFARLMKPSDADVYDGIVEDLT